MHDYGRYALLVGRIPVFLLASICTKYSLYSCIQPPKTKVSQKCPPYLPICGISPPLQVNFHVLPLKPSNFFSFLCHCFQAREEVKKLVFLSSILYRVP